MELAIFGFISGSVSMRVKVFVYEYQFSFISKLELIATTKNLLLDSL